MSIPVTTFSAGAPAAAGLFTGKAAAGGADFLAVMDAMSGSTGEAAAGTEDQAPGQAQENAPETPAAPYLNTVSPFRNHLSEVQAALPGDVVAGTVEPVPAAAPETPAPAPAPDESVRDIQDEETATAPEADGFVPASAVLQVPAAVPAQAAAVVVAVAEQAEPTSAAPAAASPAVAVSTAPAAAQQTPMQVPAAAAGRSAENVPAMVSTTLPAAGTADAARPQVFTVSEAAAAPQADAPAAPAAPSAPVPVQGQTVQSAPAAQPVHAPGHVPPPLHTQLAKPMFTLAAAGNGEHVMTMKVTPEDLGTVTVRAVIGPEGVRMELFAADAARDAVKAIMPDLRRELAGAGLNASLDLGTGARPETSGGEGRQQRDTRSADIDPRQGSREQPPARSQRMFTDRAASLDVLA